MSFFYDLIDNLELEEAIDKGKFAKIFLNDGFSFIAIPVNPERIDITSANKNSTYDIYKGGEINVLNPKGLSTISFKGFFPFLPKDFPYLTNDVLLWRPITWYARFFKVLMTNGKPCRLTIPSMGISMMVSIENFDQSEEFGDDDRWYDLTVKEWRPTPIISGTINPDGTLTIDEGRLSENGKFALGEKIKARGRSFFSPIFRTLSPTILTDVTDPNTPKNYKEIEDKVVKIVLQDPTTKLYMVADEEGNSLGWMDSSSFTSLNY